eukprot:scaffold3536_cov64-Phaeocystis_antarctica.AAC.3
MPAGCDPGARQYICSRRPRIARASSYLRASECVCAESGKWAGSKAPGALPVPSRCPPGVLGGWLQEKVERTCAIEHETLFAELSRVHAIPVLPPRQRLIPRTSAVRDAADASRAVEGLACFRRPVRRFKVKASDLWNVVAGVKGDHHGLRADELIHETRAPVVRRSPALQIELEARVVNGDRNHFDLVQILRLRDVEAAQPRRLREPNLRRTVEHGRLDEEHRGVGCAAADAR